MDPTAVVLSVVALLFALAFHEAAHAWTADRLGDPTARRLGRVTLNPIAHIDPFMTLLFPALMIYAGLPPFGAAKPVPVDTSRLAHPRRDHAVIAAAGPVSNLILVVVSVVLLRLLLAVGFARAAPSLLAVPVLGLLQMSILVNLLLAAFNILPIPPLDGSWILRALLPGRLDRLYRTLQPYGFVILLLLIYSGTLWVFLGPVMAFGRSLASG